MDVPGGMVYKESSFTTAGMQCVSHLSDNAFVLGQ